MGQQTEVSLKIKVGNPHELQYSAILQLCILLKKKKKQVFIYLFHSSMLSN